MAKRRRPSKPSAGDTRRKRTDKPVSADEIRREIARLERDQRGLDRDIVDKLSRHAMIDQEISHLRAKQDAARRRPGTTQGRDTTAEIARLVEQNPGPLSGNTIQAVFRELAGGCRELARSLRVAYLGPEYSYSHLAAIERFGTSCQLVPVGTIAAVFEEVADATVDFGLVPLENSTDGRIADTLDMFTRVRVKISDEVQLRIHHALLGSGPRSRIRIVCSKPQALSQCRTWLAKHLPMADLEETTSTTVAAERAARESHVAAIASRQAGTIYGLDVLAMNVEDNKNNVTRFAVIGESSASRTGNDKTSVLFQLAHQPGALADAMTVFKRNRLNLTWIESFPLSGQPNEYLFFVELQGHEADLRVRRALTALEKKTEMFELLGSYASGVLYDV